MAFTSAGFPSELIKEVFVNAQGHSSLAKLSGQEPLAFSGTDIMVFTLDGEVNLVAEGAAKGAHTGENTAVKMVPLKIEYGQRVSDEFVPLSSAQTPLTQTQMSLPLLMYPVHLTPRATSRQVSLHSVILASMASLLIRHSPENLQRSQTAALSSIRNLLGAQTLRESTESLPTLTQL